MAIMEERYARAAQVRTTRRPKQLAVVDQSGCTGCEVCVEVCPVDCIETVPGPDPENPSVHRLVEIDLPRCIGCTLCVQYCPWDTIFMRPFDESYQIAPQWTIRGVIGEDMWAREPVKEVQKSPRRRPEAADKPSKEEE